MKNTWKECPDQNYEIPTHPEYENRNAHPASECVLTHPKQETPNNTKSPKGCFSEVLYRCNKPWNTFLGGVPTHKSKNGYLRLTKIDRLRPRFHHWNMQTSRDSKVVKPSPAWFPGWTRMNKAMLSARSKMGLLQFTNYYSNIVGPEGLVVDAKHSCPKHLWRKRLYI